MNETEALLKLTSFPNLKAPQIMGLVDYFGSAYHATQVSIEELSAIVKVQKEPLQFWKGSTDWERHLQRAEEQSVQVISYLDPRYPVRLRQTKNFPLFLYVKGDASLLSKASFAVIGTRNPTGLGLDMAKRFTGELAVRGFSIVSGLARGIDTAVHQQALKMGKTIAVVGAGFSHLYPKENSYLADKIAERGALVSEYPIDTPIERHQFLQRNRIVAGLSEGILLIEASEKSGSMSTMEYAKKFKRKAFAFLGPEGVDSFSGNHALLKNGQAAAVERTEEILNEPGDLFGKFFI